MSEKFDDAAVNRRARQLWDDDRRSYGLAPAELHTLHIDVWNAWRDKARAELTAEAQPQPQPDPEAAVLAKAKDMLWGKTGWVLQADYLRYARTELAPKAPPAPPTTEAEIRERLFQRAGMLPDEVVAEIHSWLTAKGEAA